MGNYWDPRTRKVMIREHGPYDFQLYMKSFGSLYGSFETH